MPVTQLGAVSKQRIPPISYLPFGRPDRREAERRFEAEMRAVLASDVDVIPLGRARAGIYLLVEQAVRDGRRKVLMSPYTIADLANMVRLAGGEPVFYDFLPDSTACDLDNLQSLLDAETACVIVTHYHVNEPNMDAIAELCAARGVALFDDCALAFGGSSGGRPIGTIADAGVFSFSSFKTINYFWGGAIVTRQPELAARLRERMSTWAPLTPRDYAKPAKGCARYDFASRPLPFRLVTFPMLRRRAQASGVYAGLEHQRLETEYFDHTLQSIPSARALVEWYRKIPKIAETLAHRRGIARIYRELHQDHMVSARQAPGQNFDEGCFVNFPVLVPSAARDDIVREMMEQGFDVGRNLYPNVHRHEVFAGAAGTSSVVDDLVGRAIYLPTHFGVSAHYAKAISSALRDCIARRSAS